MRKRKSTFNIGQLQLNPFPGLRLTTSLVLPRRPGDDGTDPSAPHHQGFHRQKLALPRHSSRQTNLLLWGALPR
ncbi:hypothetical protein RND71_033954 [Anisodus tanguticus]|uniref:Uncharacterized protein n=1 Tax=Anisodus tanguticus TaxID=243964 RepID=A0AAE1R8Q8_9SOLA|nr:hypothetical protein RND71_033954 [Anisodus tanguticus]